MIKKIYVDHNATTPVKSEVFEAMKPYFTDVFGNPSSIHSFGREAKEALDGFREQVARILHCDSREVYFTSCGTESDNWAIKGTAEANKNRGRHIITSAIEHHGVLSACEYLEKQGWRVTYVSVDKNGIINVDELQNAICDETVLISVMTANNEIGTIQPINEIAKIARAKGISFHTDAVAAMGQVELNMEKMRDVSMLSLAGHKIGAPKGVGMLYIRTGTKILPLLHGGSQERKLRAGTENLPYIAGFAKAMELAENEREEHCIKMLELREAFINKVSGRIPHALLNGDRYARLCSNVNFSFKFIEGESLLLMLDMAGIAASSGSACTSGSLVPSHVLLAIGLPHEVAHGSLRISFGDENTMDDVDTIVNELERIVARLRQMSPLYNEQLTIDN